MENLGKSRCMLICPDCGEENGEVLLEPYYDIDYQKETITMYYDCLVCKHKWFFEIDPIMMFVEINRMMLGLDHIKPNNGGGDDD